MEGQNSSLLDILTSWRDAVASHKEGRYQETIDVYDSISENSARMRYNVACAYMKLGDNENAIQNFNKAVQIDEHLAIGFFQRGALYLLVKRTEEAGRDFDTAYTLLRGNPHIDYKPLGLFVRLLMSEVLYNRAMVQLQKREVGSARSLLRQALYCTDSVKKDQLRSALNFLENLKPEMVMPLQKSADHVFMPPKSVIENLVCRAKIGKATIVATNSLSGAGPMARAERRVQELLQQPKPKSPGSPLNVMRRFFKNSPISRRSQSTADVRLATDIQTSPTLKKATSNWILRKNKSTSDVNFPRNRFRSKGSNSVESINSLTPTFPVRGFDVLSYTPSNEEIHLPTTPDAIHRKSLGSIFGSSSTVVKKGLSLSCDLFTAFVTPFSEPGNRAIFTYGSNSSDTTTDDSRSNWTDDQDLQDFSVAVPCVTNWVQRNSNVDGTLTDEEDGHLVRRCDSETGTKTTNLTFTTVSNDSESLSAITDCCVPTSGQGLHENPDQSTTIEMENDEVFEENVFKADSQELTYRNSKKTYAFDTGSDHVSTSNYIEDLTNITICATNGSASPVTTVSMATKAKPRPPPPSYPPPLLPTKRDSAANV